jgi:hypothetical protein
MTRWLYQVTCWALWFLITDETGWKLGTDLIKAIWKSHYFKHVFSYVTAKMLGKSYAKWDHVKSSHKNMCSITYHALIWNLKAKQCTDIFGVLLWLFFENVNKVFQLSVINLMDDTSKQVFFSKAKKKKFPASIFVTIKEEIESVPTQCKCST